MKAEELWLGKIVIQAQRGESIVLQIGPRVVELFAIPNHIWCTVPLDSITEPDRPELYNRKPESI